MDFNDELPCGGYADEDDTIRKQIEVVSKQSECISIGHEQAKNEKQCIVTCGQCPKGTRVPQTLSLPKEYVMNIKWEDEHKRQLEGNYHSGKVPLCRKCKQYPSVLLLKNDPVCRDCLLKSIEYKCRLTLQNIIKVRPTSNILVAVSGGLSSSCLATGIGNLQRRYQKNKLFAKVTCIHVQQQLAIDPLYPKKFKETTGLELVIVPITRIYGYETEIEKLQGIRMLLKEFPSSANTADLLSVFRDRILLSYAKEHNYNFIIKALNGDSLAIETFKFFTKGIGGNIPELCEQQSEGLFHFPFRNHLLKELQYFYYTNKLGSLALPAHNDDLSNHISQGIDNHIKHFITSVQNMYSHTVSAIVRTSEKIESQRVNDFVCSWCFLKGTSEGRTLCQRCVRIADCCHKDSGAMPHWMKINTRRE